MKKFKEKRMASYVLRSNELIQEGKTKEAAELFGKGLGYFIIVQTLFMPLRLMQPRMQDLYLLFYVI